MSRKLLGNAGHGNLRKGSKKGEKKKPYAARTSPEVKKISLKLLSRPKYQADLAARLDDGTLHPSLQVMLWQYAHGKAKEEIEVKQIVPVRIEHHYED